MLMKNIVVFTGAGVSAESGLSTFRDNGGIWDEFPVEEVATLNAWEKNPIKVIEFYNLRRKLCLMAKPNMAHQNIQKLEKKFNVNIITQNIDDLHERAGSKNVLHLHGEIMLSRSTKTGKTFRIKKDLKYGDKCSDNFLLRPHVVWFGEEVPKMKEAYKIINKADVLIIIGTSLKVYPAADLINFIKENCKVFLIDPNPKLNIKKVTHLKKNAVNGTKELYENLMVDNQLLKIGDELEYKSNPEK